MPRIATRAPPAGLLARQVPRPWCTRCGGTRHPVKIHGSPRVTYSCPNGCDDYDPKRGLI